jgi:RNA polymerase sigma-70 factor (ECF subfamily)
MKNLSEGELLRSHAMGRKGAFTELVTRHQRALLAHARGILGPGSVFEDVVQEVFLRLTRENLVLSAVAGGDPEGERKQLLAWLHKVTRNACMDIIRSEARRRSREQESAPREGSCGGLDIVESRDTLAAVERELERLSDDQREVLTLRLIAERSYREIAEITGRKIGTVGWLVSEGLKALGERLAPMLSVDPRHVPVASSPTDQSRAMDGGSR